MVDDDSPGVNFVIIYHELRIRSCYKPQPLFFTDGIYFGAIGSICALSGLPEEWLWAKEW